MAPARRQDEREHSSDVATSSIRRMVGAAIVADSGRRMSTLPIALLAFAAGATLLQWQAKLPQVAPWFAASAALAFLAVASNALVRRSQARSRCAGRAVTFVHGTMVAAAAATLGFGHAAWRAETRLADQLPPAWEGVDIALVGIVDDLPRASPRGTRFAFAVERIETPGAIVPPRLSLAWYAVQAKDGTSVSPPPVRAGERWRMVVRLKRPHGTVNPDGFDIEAWLLENNLRATGYVRGDGSNSRLDRFAGRPSDYVERARERVRSRILAALPHAPYAGVIVALAIGDQRAIPERQWRVFNRTGITHLISISGLHVTVFAALAGALAYALARRSVRLTTRVPARKLAAAVGVAAAAAYVLLAGSQVPAQRTLLMLAVAALGLWLARPGTAAMVWLWALAAVVAWDPWAGVTPGFWLSFGSVGLLLYAHAGRLRSPPAVTRRARIRRALRLATRTQLLVTIGLVPLTLALFQQVSAISPLANALAIPVVTFAVVPLALAGILLPLDALWQAAHTIFAMLMAPLLWLAQLPGAVWQQHAPPGWAVVAALVGVAWLAAPRGVPGRALGALWFLPLFVVAPPRPAAGTFRMTVLDVGQGLAVVVETHRHALLYDTGPRYTDDADAGGRIVAPFLRAAGITRLGGLVVSHRDSDHSGGAATLLHTVPVDWLLSSLSGDHELPGDWSAMDALRLRCVAGQRWDWDGVHFTVLHPPAAYYDNPLLKANDLSCVLRVDSGFGSALLTGDIEARSETELLRNAGTLKADVLLVPHHGSRTSSTAPFIAAVAAPVAVFTPGYRNRFGHPRPDVVARYAATGAQLRRTDLDGAVAFEFAPGAPPGPRAWREQDRRYWRDAPVREANSPPD
jgi:competence protein ComEC